MDSVSSTTFIKRPPSMTDAQENLLYTRELLAGRIFSGCYQERRYVSILNEYRDLVIISPEETDLHQDLDRVRRKLLSVVGVKWVGITGPEVVGMPRAYCFWVMFSNLPFGQYWFQIRHVKFAKGEVFFQLKCIRKYNAPSYVTESHYQSASHGIKSTITKNEETHTTGEYLTSSAGNVDFRSAFLSFFRALKEPILIIMCYITWRNIFTSIRVICGLTLALIMGTISCVSHIGEYILKLIRELSMLVNAFTPIIIHIIDFFSKVVGGFYILLAGMFSKNGPHPSLQNHRENKMFSIPQTIVLKKPSDPPALYWKERNKMLRMELLSRPRQM